MKHYFFPTLLFAGWLVVLVIFMTPEAPNGHGLPHDRIAQMDQGGPGLERHRPLFVTGWLLGSILIAAFVGLLAWVTAGHGDRRFTILDAAFFGGWIAFEGVFTAMCLAYYQWATNPPPPTFLGPFPTATAGLLFGMWLVPGIFIVLYVVFFHCWIAPPANQERFDALVRETRGG